MSDTIIRFGAFIIRASNNRLLLMSVLFALIVALVLVMLGIYYAATSTPTAQPSEELQLVVQDKPLLTEEQKQEIAEDNTVTIRVGNELHIYFLTAREALKDYL